ncbi:putative serine proteinase stubble [Penaeus vannamei]|uniref:Putative serine proteinase stubble n=1 Tax=Penaeus vannamei TaxID=6689 RepID=A0A423SFM0_PENVA|nr:putative serine proteinase stubble [Penaeus vannamei]
MEVRSSSGHRRLQIEPRQCHGADGEPGVCMFNFECYQRGGHVVGTCIDGFLFGACCDLPEGATLPTETPVAAVIPEVPAEVDLTGSGPESVAEEEATSGGAASSSGGAAGGAVTQGATTTEVIVPGIVNVRVPEASGPEDETSESGGPGETSTEMQVEATSANSEDVHETDGMEDVNTAGPTEPSANSDDEGAMATADDSANGGDSMDVEDSTVKSTDVTEADEVSNQMESSIDDQGALLTSVSLLDATPPATEPSSKFHSDVETGIPDVLAEGGVITFTIVESAAPTSEGPGADAEENTEQVIMMTLPDGQDGFATHEIVNFDVTDALNDGEENTENPGLMLSPSDELYFEPKPTSHRPYVRPASGQKTSTSDPLLAWEDEATPPPVDVSAQTIYVLSQTTDEAEVGILTTDKPPEPTVVPDSLERTSTEAISLLTPQTTESTTEPILIWTLSPQPSILDARPPTSVISQVESHTSATMPKPASKPAADEEETQGDIPQPAAPVTTSKPPQSTEKTPASEEGTPDLEDPLAFWTTTRPKRPRPRPKPTTTDEPLLIWTTTKKPPQATTTASSASVSVTPEDEDLFPDPDIPLQPAIIPGDILQHITGDLLHGAQNQTTADATTTTPWASSTYSIATVKYEDPSVNTLTDAPQQSTTMADEVTLTSTSQVDATTTTTTTTTTTRPKTTTSRPTTITTTTERTTQATTTKKRRPTMTTTRRTTTRRPTTKNPTRRPPSRRPSTRKPSTQRPTTRRTTAKPPRTTTKGESTTRPTTDEPISPIDQIVNGERADFAEWPWQALIKESTWLGIFTKNKCGGVLLNRKYVLTAAHCQPGFLASLIVVLGEFDLSDDYEPKKTVQRNVKRVVVHRGYVAKTFDNDLALLEMERPVTFDEHIVPICMPQGDENFTGMIGFVTGWGRLSYGGPVPTQLNEVAVPIIKNNDCQKWFLEAGHIKNIKPEFFCAGYKEGKKDSCEGDSGGPLSVQGEDGRWVLAGTVSHGIKCAYPNLPGVYMKMTYYKPWIESIIN